LKIGRYFFNNKNMNPQEFGDLLLFDKFPITVLEIEQQYHIYLFEQVLICCKDLTDLQKKREKPDTPTKYEIQGKIYSQTISDVVDTCNSDLQTFVVKIYWNENSESFLLKCRNIEQAKLWKSRVMNCARAQGSSPTALQRSNSVKDSGMQYGRNRSINAKMDIMDGGSRKSMPASAKRTEMDPKKVQTVKRYPQPTPRGESLEMRRKTQNVLTQSPLPMRGQNSPAPQSPLPARGPPDSALPRPPSQRNPSAPPESDLPRPPSQRTPSARRPSIGQGGASFSGPPDASLPSPPSHRRPSNGPPGQLPQRPPASLLPQPSLPKNISLPPNNFTPPPGSPLPRPPMMSPPILRAPSTPLPQPPRSSNPLSPPSQRRTSVTRTSNSSLIKMKTYYLEEIFILAMPSSGCGFKEVLEKIERKIKICGAPMPSGRSIKLRYRDEDGDYISINGDDDVEMAFDLARRQGVKGTVMIQVE
jgi:cell division control protein 24